jgi:tetratricopeptide (TPR) repeat protein
MELWFCEDCGLRVSEADLSQGAVRDKENFKVYCKSCVAKRAPVQTPVQTVQVSAPAARKSGLMPSVRPSGRMPGQTPGKGASNARVTPATRPTPQSGRTLVPATRSKTETQIPRQPAPRSPQPLPTGLIVGGAIGVGVLVGGITLFLLSGSKTDKHVDKPAESADQRPRPAASQAENRPAASPAQPATQAESSPRPTTLRVPNDDPEARASDAFEAVRKRIAGELKDDKTAQVAALDEFLKKYGETIVGSRAQVLKNDILSPKSTAAAPAPAPPAPAQQPETHHYTDAEILEMCNRTGAILNKGDPVGSIAECDKCIQLCPNIGALYINRADAKRFVGDFEGVLADTDMAAKCNYTLWQLPIIRAVALYAMHRDEEAGKEFQKARDICPDPRMLEATYEQGKVRARALYDGKQLEGKTLSTGPEYLARGTYRVLSRHFNEGRADLEQAAKLDATLAPSVYTTLGNIAANGKDWKGRLDTYRRWSEVTPDSVDALNSYAWELLTSPDKALQDVKAALPIAEKADKLSGSSNYGVLDTLALADFRNGKVDEAVSLEKKAIGLLPANTPEPTRKEYDQHLAEFEAGLKEVK